MARLLIHRIDHPIGTEEFLWWCPACQCGHSFRVAGRPPLWTFNGNFDRPGFWPSLRYVDGTGCHTIVAGGIIQFCNDCRHDFVGKTVPMVDWDTILGKEEKTMSNALHTVNGKPVETPAPAAAEKQAANTAPQTHKKECGDVGVTGDHGDLGTNAA